MIYRWLSQYAKAFAQGFIFGLPVCITFVDNVCGIARVHGISMQPTLNPDARSGGDIVVLSRWAIRDFRAIKKGDIVSVLDPTDPSIVLIKRVVALEGDRVRTLKHRSKLVAVPRGHCWVEGDNHTHSMDSNSFGPVALGLVQSKATYIIWPPRRWSRIESFLPENRRPVDVNELEELENLVVADTENRTETKRPDELIESPLPPEKIGPVNSL